MFCPLFSPFSDKETEAQRGNFPKILDLMSIRARTESTAAVCFLRSSGGWWLGKDLHSHCLGTALPQNL